MIYRQGDVLIQIVKELPKELTPVAREAGRIVLAHGELTGHAHAIHEAHASLRATALGQMFLEIVDEPAHVVHEEHTTVKLPHGLYRVTRQTEYSPAALRNVAD